MSNDGSDTEKGQTPLIFIHGAWLSARSWENYADYFGKRGYAVSAPEWPRKQGDVEELRKAAEASAGLGVQEIVDHYEQLIRDLDQPPVLIGHSYGGLFVELLLDRGLGRAGVAMSPAPPKGILALPFSTLKAAVPALAHPSKWHGVVTLTPEEFTYGFVNTFSEEDAAAAYEQYAVPETGQIFYEGGFANFHLHPPDRGSLHERGPRAAAARRRDRGPHRAGVADKGAVQALRALAGEDRLPRVRGPAAPAHGRPRLAGGRRRGRQLARRRPGRAGRGHGAGLVSRPRMDLELSNKFAVVTGANEGVGFAITEALMDEGPNVLAGLPSTHFNQTGEQTTK